MTTVSSSDNSVAFAAATATVERWTQAGPTDEEKVVFLANINQTLGDDAYGDNVDKQMKELKNRVYKTDKGFAQLKNDMDEFVQLYGNEQPGIKPFQAEWTGYKENWTHFLTTSRDYALKTARDYENYIALLERIEQVKTKEELQILAADLAVFAKNKPVDIPIDFEEDVLCFIRKVEKFERDYKAYIKEKVENLDEEVEKLIQEVDALKAEVATFNEQIIDAISKLGFTPWLGFLGAAISGTVLGGLVAKRLRKQQDLDDATNKLQSYRYSDMLLSWFTMEVLLAGLVPDFSSVAWGFRMFPSIWNGSHNEAFYLATVFKQLRSPENFPQMIKNRIEMSMIVSRTLKQSLKDYAESN